MGHTNPLPEGGVCIEGVTKRFTKRTVKKQTYTTVKSSLLSRLFSRSNSRTTSFTALDDVSLRVEPGCSFGVIGRNGSGKSTLLKLIAGIYRPDEGEVRVAGKISALIELGAGFHPDFSGRENIYLGGVMYGLSRKEIDERFNDIVRYAELEDFIDDPVRTYSSGMYMRLGFSLAVFTDPDILLIDEVLAVGDAGFIHKCQDTISEFKRRGKTLFFVTHDLNAVAQWCDEALWLDSGLVRERGEPVRVIDSYLEHVEAGEGEKLKIANEEQLKDLKMTPSDKNRWGNRDVEITAVRMTSEKGEEGWMFRADDAVTISVDYTIHQEVKDLVFGIGILRMDGLSIHGTNTDIEDIVVPLPDFKNSSGKSFTGTYHYRIDRLGLTEGSYALDVAAHGSDGLAFDYHHELYKFSVRSAKKYQGVLSPEHKWSFDTAYEVHAG